MDLVEDGMLKMARRGVKTTSRESDSRDTVPYTIVT